MKIKSLSQQIIYASVFIILLPSYLGVKLGALPLINMQRFFFIYVFFIFFIGLNKIKIGDFFKRYRLLSFVSLAYLIIRIASSLYSDTPSYSIFIFLLDFFTIYFAFFASYLMGGEGHVKVFSLLIISSFLVILFFVFWESTFEVNLYKFIVPKSLLSIDYIASAMEDKIRGKILRAQGPFLHPLVLSQYANFILPIIFLSLANLVRNRLLLSLFIVAFCFFDIYMVISTGSRSGLAVIAVQVFVFIFYVLLKSKSRFNFILKFSVFIPCVFLLCVNFFQSSLSKEILEGKNNSENMSTEARLFQYAMGIKAVSLRPYLGYGPGNAINYAYSTNITTGENSIDSYYLNILVDSGYIGLFLYVCLVVIFLFLLFKRAFINNDKNALCNLMLLCAFLSLLVTSSTLSSYELFPYASVLLGFLFRVYRCENE